MINIAVCDDQPIHLRKIMKMVRDTCLYKIPEKMDYRSYDGFYSAEKVISFLKTNKIDILFLDIEMEGMNGFELAGLLKKEFPDIIIIFVSAYENYVYNSFEYSPFRFIRKTRIEEELEPALVAAVDSLMSLNKKIELKTTDGTFETRVADIIYFESNKNYLTVHLIGNKSYSIRNTVTGISKELQSDDFFKIHQAYVINLANVKRISGYAEVLMCNDKILPISSRNAQSFKKAYMEYTNRRIAK